MCMHVYTYIYTYRILFLVRDSMCLWEVSLATRILFYHVNITGMSIYSKVNIVKVLLVRIYKTDRFFSDKR